MTETALLKALHKFNEDGLRVGRDAVLPLPDVNRAVVKGNRLDLTEFVSAHVEIFAATELGFLRRKPVTVNRRFGGAASLSRKNKTGEPGPFIHQVLIREISQPEVLPPRRFFFSAVPLEIDEDGFLYTKCDGPSQ